MQPFLIALQFLTCLPIRLHSMPEPRLIGRSLLYYPLVGLLLGGMLCLLGMALGNAATPLKAAVLLTAWVWLTGALHLDGLADSADAWLGGFGDRERTLAIMKDPCSGPVAVAVLVLLLLLKCVALWTLLEQGNLWMVLAVPVLGRSAMMGLFLTTAYVRPGGLGQALAEHMPRSAARMVLGLILLVGVAMGVSGWIALGIAAAVGVLVRRSLVQRLGGTTGDTAGALLELVECAVLIGLALLG